MAKENRAQRLESSRGRFFPWWPSPGGVQGKLLFRWSSIIIGIIYMANAEIIKNPVIYITLRNLKKKLHHSHKLAFQYTPMTKHTAKRGGMIWIVIKDHIILFSHNLFMKKSLVCFVAISAYGHLGIETYDPCSYEMHELEIAKFLFAKCSIGNSPININCGSSSSQVSHFLFCQGLWESKSFRSFATWRDNRQRSNRKWLWFHFGKIGSKRKFPNTDIPKMNNVICRSLSRIFNNYESNRPYIWTENPGPGLTSVNFFIIWRERVGNIANINSIYKDICPQLSSCSTNHYDDSPDKCNCLNSRSTGDNIRGQFGSHKKTPI
jgi:hypothetical protein